MKQTAFLYALGQLASRLLAVRKRTWLLLGLGVAAVTALLAWAAVAVLTWAWGQATGVVDTGRQAAGGVLERVEQAVPGVAQALAPWVGGRVAPADSGATAPDVSGNDPAGVVRPAGLTRTYYANEAGRQEVRYAGSGDMHAVLRHYVGELESAGYRHDILLATPATERHRFGKGGLLRELELRRTGAADGFEVAIVDQAR